MLRPCSKGCLSWCLWKPSKIQRTGISPMNMVFIRIPQVFLSLLERRWAGGCRKYPLQFTSNLGEPGFHLLLPGLWNGCALGCQWLHFILFLKINFFIWKRKCYPRGSRLIYLFWHVSYLVSEQFPFLKLNPCISKKEAIHLVRLLQWTFFFFW